MPSADPQGDGFTLIYETLAADTTFMGAITGLWRTLAPPLQTPDYAVITAMSGVDDNSGFKARFITQCVFLVKLIGPQTHEANLRAAYARADTLLNPGGFPLRNTLNTLACYREQVATIPDPVSGAGWLNVIGWYRVEV